MAERHETYTIDTAESDPKSSSTLLVGAVGVSLTIFVVLLLEVLFQRTNEAEQRRKLVLEQPQQLLQLRAEQTERLQEYRLLDPQQQIYAIPIERAMELVVAEQAAPTGR